MDGPRAPGHPRWSQMRSPARACDLPRRAPCAPADHSLWPLLTSSPAQNQSGVGNIPDCGPFLGMLSSWLVPALYPPLCTSPGASLRPGWSSCKHSRYPGGPLTAQRPGLSKELKVTWPLPRKQPSSEGSSCPKGTQAHG